MMLMKGPLNQVHKFPNPTKPRAATMKPVARPSTATEKSGIIRNFYYILNDLLPNQHVPNFAGR